MSARTSVLEGGRLQVLGLISTGHFCSHFYYMVLPPLFPLLTGAYGVGYAELGLALMVFSLANALTAAPVGVLVDRIGARVILVVGLAVEALVFMTLPLVPTFPVLVVCMAVAGACNSVFHPANYAILDARIAEEHMGRAFSIHSFGGYLGAAVAPVVVASLAALAGWQIAVFMTGVGGLAVAALLALNAAHLTDAKDAAPSTEAPAARGPGALRVLLSAPILMGVAFFAVLAIAEYGITDFGVASLHLMYDVSLPMATFALSVYLFGGPLGVLAGGWLADRCRRHGAVVATCMLLFTACVGAIAALEPAWPVVVVLLAAAGFAAGLVTPSRDLIIRSVTPVGDVGKVFGFVAVGLTLGGIVSRPLYGLQLDHLAPVWLFVAAALFGLLSAGIAVLTSRGRHPDRRPQ